MTAGANPMDLKRGIEQAVEAAVEHLKEIGRPVEGKKEIEQVGTISANNDHITGQLIAEVMEKVGKDGVITVEEAKSMETALDVVEGMQFDVFSRKCMLSGKGGQEFFWTLFWEWRTPGESAPFDRTLVGKSRGRRNR